MTFDINQLKDTDWEDENALYNYIDEVIKAFWDSPEAQAHRQIYPDMGFYSSQLIEYGYTYADVTLPEMMEEDIEEILTEIFPRKISVLPDDDLKHVIPELIAFWNYLGREYELKQAPQVIKTLQQIEPDFPRLMRDPSRFGMAKSLFMAGQAAGFDMSDEEEMQRFMLQYNANLMARAGAEPSPPALGSGSFFDPIDSSSSSLSRTEQAKKKKKRKMAAASRKKNRKKK